jgi:CRISPR-associated protein Csd1
MGGEMIVSSLINYYDRLAEAGDPRIAPLGYSWQKIGFAVVIVCFNPRKSSRELRPSFCTVIEDRRQEIYPSPTKKNPNPKPFLKARPMLVPGQAKPSGSGINPNFMWDQPGYMIGYRPEDQKPERTAEAFAAFREKHLALEKEINAPEFSAVCRWLECWESGQLSDEAKKIIDHGGFGVFQIRGQQRYVHEVPAVQAYWQAQGQGEDERPLVPSIVSGEMVKSVRLHEPKIKGVRGTNMGGAPLVGFNCSSFESYSFEQGDNAPMSGVEAFRYCTALNILTSSQRVYIDDTTVAYWTGAPAEAESFLGFVFDRLPEDGSLKEKVRAALTTIKQGRKPQEFGDLATAFYVLGLAGDAGRISVRYWHQSTLEDFYSRLQEHFNALAIEREHENQPEFPSLWALCKAAVRQDEKGKYGDIPRGLPEALLRAIIEGTNYPMELYTAVLRRMRIEGRVGYLKAAIIKAVLIRNYDAMNDEQEQGPSYRLGRLLAVLERLQDAAVGSAPINGFFGSASVTPGLVFPRLIRGAQPHYAKLKAQGKVRLAIWYQKLVQEILEPITAYPPRLNLIEQGLYGLGYYHQRRALFTRAPAEVVEAANNETETV